MTKVRRRRKWNILAIASVVLAALLSIVGVTSLNVDQVPGRDSLRLSSASRALTTSVDRLPRDGWSSQRGESLSGGEIQADIDALDDAQYHVKIGVYSNSTYDLDLSIPSFSSNGYVWMRWKQPLQDYLEANDTDLQEHVLLLNALLSDADPVLNPVQDRPAILSDGTYY